MLPYFAQPPRTRFVLPSADPFMMAAQTMMTRVVEPHGSLWVTADYLGNQTTRASLELSYHTGRNDISWAPDLESTRHRPWPPLLPILPLNAIPDTGYALGNMANLDSGRDSGCFVSLCPDDFNALAQTSLQEFGIIPRSKITSTNILRQQHLATETLNIELRNPSYADLQSRADSRIETNARSKVDTQVSEALALQPLPPYAPIPARMPISRMDMLEHYRCRLGLGNRSIAEPWCQYQRELLDSRSPGPRGALLSISVLGRIVGHLLSTVTPDTSTSHVLASLARTSKRIRSVVAPYVYEHVALRANGDIGVYARTGAAKHVRRLTIYFNAQDSNDPHDIRQDDEAFPEPALSGNYEKRGLSYTFAQCREIRLVAKYVSEQPQHIFPFSLDNGIPALSDMIPPTVGRVILESDRPDMAAQFVAKLAARSGRSDLKVIVELRTNRDDVVQSAERAIYFCVSQESIPNDSQLRLILNGSSYGTEIRWNDSTVTQTAWRNGPVVAQTNTFDRSSRRTRDEDQDDEVLGPKELIAGIPRPNANVLKYRIIASLYASSKRTLRKKGQNLNPAPIMPHPAPIIVSTLIPKPDSSVQRQNLARSAGKLAAEMPATVERMVEELKKNEPMPPCPCPSHQQAATDIIRHPATKAELDAFVESYFARWHAARTRSAKLEKMQEQAKAKSDQNKVEQDTTGTAIRHVIEGPSRKRRRRL